LEAKIKNRLIDLQVNEITEHLIYEKLSRETKDSHNKEILQRISKDELRHYNIWKDHTEHSPKPNKFKIWLFYIMAKVLGITFGIKLMEMGEIEAEKVYGEIVEHVPAAAAIVADEHKHEKQLISMIDEERLKYIGDVVRGLNTALIELMGAVAGFTLALQDTRFIVTAGLITGIAMSLSLAGTEYLATKSSEGSHNPVKSGIYSGAANLLAVLLLLFPYFVFSNIYFSLVVMIIIAVVIVFLFTFYVSVALEISLKRRFLEMVLISFGTAALAFAVGFLARMLLHIDAGH